MSEIVFACQRHGGRTDDQVYRSKDKSCAQGFRFKCKECVYFSAFKRPCKIHGDVPKEARTPGGVCSICNLNVFRKMNKIRDSGRDAFNEKQRLKREANPEVAKDKRKKEYDRRVELYGNDGLNEQNKAGRFGLSIVEYRQMFIDQDNKCAICNQPETRIFTQRTEKREMQIAKLCLDHNHETGKLRQLLCHDCNTGIGKFKDDIQRLQSAINYLKKHKDD